MTLLPGPQRRGGGERGGSHPTGMLSCFFNFWFPMPGPKLNKNALKHFDIKCFMLLFTLSEDALLLYFSENTQQSVVDPDLPVIKRLPIGGSTISI